MNNYIVTWQQVSSPSDVEPSDVFIIHDIIPALSLPLAVGQWSSKRYANAEILSVHLANSKIRRSAFVQPDLPF